MKYRWQISRQAQRSHNVHSELKFLIQNRRNISLHTIEAFCRVREPQNRIKLFAGNVRNAAIQRHSQYPAVFQSPTNCIQGLGSGLAKKIDL